MVRSYIFCLCRPDSNSSSIRMLINVHLREHHLVTQWGRMTQRKCRVHSQCFDELLQIILEERVGFEPTEGYYPSPVFKTGSINHSDTSP